MIYEIVILIVAFKCFIFIFVKILKRKKKIIEKKKKKNNNNNNKTVHNNSNKKKQTKKQKTKLNYEILRNHPQTSVQEFLCERGHAIEISQVFLSKVVVLILLIKKFSSNFNIIIIKGYLSYKTIKN